MEISEEKIVIDADTWSDDIEQLLAEAGGVQDVRKQVQAGSAQLFSVWRGEKRVAAFVLRVEETAGGYEGVIVAAAGKDDQINLTDEVLPFIEGMFRDVDCVRIHTARRGLAKKLLLRGYQCDEIVLRKKVRA